MDEHTTKCDTKMGRNIKQAKHIVPPIPKEKQGRAPTESPILLRRETSYGLGVLTQKILHSALHGLHHPRTPIHDPHNTPLDPTPSKRLKNE